MRQHACMTVAKKGTKCQYLILPKMVDKTIFKRIQLLDIFRIILLHMLIVLTL
jgi:hypothetical protein